MSGRKKLVGTILVLALVAAMLLWRYVVHYSRERQYDLWQIAHQYCRFIERNHGCLPATVGDLIGDGYFQRTLKNTTWLIESPEIKQTDECVPVLGERVVKCSDDFDVEVGHRINEYHVRDGRVLGPDGVEIELIRHKWLPLLEAQRISVRIVECCSGG